MNENLDTDVRTSQAVRRAIRQSPDSIRSLARLYGVNPKTVAKWRGRSSSADLPRGPRTPRSTVLGAVDEALCAAFRGQTRLPLDDCLAALRIAIPALSRSSLHRCLKRHGLSRAAEPADMPVMPAGCFDISLVEMDLGEGRARILVAVERSSRFIVARLCDGVAAGAAALVSALIDAAPAPVRIVIADPRLRGGVVERSCAAHDVAFAWAESYRVLDVPAGGCDAPRPVVGKAAQERLRRTLDIFLARYNAGCRLKHLAGRTPRESFLERSHKSLNPSAVRTPKLWYNKNIADGSENRRAAGRLRNPEGTREAILAAARQRLAQDGPEGLSLAEVARLAGVNRGTAYQHFHTRENLINAAAEQVSQSLYRAVFGHEYGTRRRKVKKIDIAEVTDRLAIFAMGNPELSRAWLLQVLSSPDPARDLFWREYEGSTARFAETELAKEGIDTEVLSVIMLAGAFLWPVWAQTQAKGGEDLRPFAERFADECLRISMYGNLRSEHYPDIARRLGRRRRVARVDPFAAELFTQGQESSAPR